jgi:hypothetical protein
MRNESVLNSDFVAAQRHVMVPHHTCMAPKCLEIATHRVLVSRKALVGVGDIVREVRLCDHHTHLMEARAA